jgi:hypothetical protein
MGSGYKDFEAGNVLAAADVDGYLMRQTVMTFASSAARDTALAAVLDEGMVAYLEDTDLITVYDGAAWQIFANAAGKSYELISYTASGSFVKASYPWATTARIRLVGGGGGSGSTLATDAGEGALAGGGGGGGYAESRIAVAAMSASETVTVGTGGIAGTSGGIGGTGVTSSFGALVVAAGGLGGGPSNGGATSYLLGGAGGVGGAGTTGDILIDGSGGEASETGLDTRLTDSPGGASQLSGSHARLTSGGDTTLSAAAGLSYGGGAKGAAMNESAVATDGAAGADGIVMVELFG